jgi:hypothetical protein
VKRVLIFVLLCASSVRCQTIQVAGGASTLFGAEGGSVTLYTGDRNDTVGVGVVNGRLVAGANSEFMFRGWDVTAGDKQLFLATQQVGLSTVMRGVNAQKKTDNSQLDIFIGAVGTAYSAPYFSGETANEFGTGFAYSRKFQNVTLTTVEAFTRGKPTTLQGVVYHTHGLVLQGTAGLLERRAYLVAQGTLKFSHESFDAGRQTLIWQGLQTTVTSGSVSAWGGPIDGHASAYKSSTTQGETAGVGVHAGILQLHGDIFSSPGQRVLSGCPNS